MARMLTLLAGGTVVLLALIFASSSLLAQATDSQPLLPYGAHPLQDHWGQSATGAGLGSRWTSTTSTGLIGISTASSPTSGMYGRTNKGYGVRGQATNATAATVGVYGESASSAGKGVYGLAYSTSGSTVGVSGKSNSPSGIGVHGEGGTGVYGYSASPSGDAVYGRATGSSSSWGVRGESAGLTGIAGSFTAQATGDASNYGVYGTTYGRYGKGVAGHASAPDGIENIGVWGYVGNNNGYGVVGLQAGYDKNDVAAGYYESGMIGGGYNGVIGFSKASSGYGVFGYALGSSGYGVRGLTDDANGWAGYFSSSVGNGVSISTPAGKTGLTVAGGTKNAVVATTDGARLLYAEEATSVWFTDYGFGAVANGSAQVSIDPIFAQTVNLNEPYHVFLEPYGNSSLYVAARTPTGFTVRVHDGVPNADFSYRIVARRLGYEADRLERAPQSDNDPNLFQTTVGANPGAWLQRPARGDSDNAAVMEKTVTEKPVLDLPPEPAPVFEDLPIESPPASAPPTDVVAPAPPAHLPAGAHQLFAPVLGK